MEILLLLLLVASSTPLARAQTDVDVVRINTSLVQLNVGVADRKGRLPLVAQRFKIDPALVSAPLITTLVDATGLVIYMLIAKSILSELR